MNVGEFPNKRDTPVITQRHGLTIQLELARQYQTSRLEQTITQVADVGHHRLVEKKIAHLFVEDHVNLVIEK